MFSDIAGHFYWPHGWLSIRTEESSSAVKLDLVGTFLCPIRREFHNCIGSDSIVNVIMQVQTIIWLIDKDGVLFFYLLFFLSWEVTVEIMRTFSWTCSLKNCKYEA